MTTIILDAACQAIKDIVDDKVAFSKALKNVFESREIGPEHKSTISAFVGCELRHHYVFERFISENFGQLSTEKASPIYVALANNLFLKRLDEKECVEYVVEHVKNYNLGIEEEKVIEVLAKAGKELPLIPETLDKGSLEFLSLRFNCPLWLVKMWAKHYGRGVTYKILKSNSHIALHTCRVNTLVTTKEELLEEYQESFETACVEDMLVYKGRNSIRKEQFFKVFKVVQEKMALKYLFDQLELDYLKSCVLYCNDFTPAFLELAIRSKNEMKFDVLVPEGKNIYQYKNAIAEYKVTSVRVYECPVTGLVSVLSAPLSTIILFPKSSDFELLRSSPDYFLHFDSKKMDAAITEQNIALDECSKFIENGGQLVYAIPTVSKKESHYVITDFLRKHPEFTLKEEKQIFPFDSLDSSFYYAIIMKEDRKLD